MHRATWDESGQVSFAMSKPVKQSNDRQNARGADETQRVSVRIFVSAFQDHHRLVLPADDNIV